MPDHTGKPYAWEVKPERTRGNQEQTDKTGFPARGGNEFGADRLAGLSDSSGSSDPLLVVSGLTPFPQDKVERVIDSAVRNKLPVWRATFELARVLRSAPGLSIVTAEPIVEAFAQRLGWKVEDVFFEFSRCWDAVKNPDGQSAWDGAVKLAQAGGVVIVPDAGRTAADLARLAYYLSQMSDGEPFPFPLDRIAGSFGYSVVTASKGAKHLVRVGIIEWADPTYSYTEKRARTARFIGEALDAGDIPL